MQRLLDTKFANCCSLQCRHDGGGAERGAEVSAERTDVRAAATFDIQFEFRILVTKHIDSMNGDRACRQVEIGAFAGELVCPSSGRPLRPNARAVAAGCRREIAAARHRSSPASEQRHLELRQRPAQCRRSRCCGRAKMWPDIAFAFAGRNGSAALPARRRLPRRPLLADRVFRRARLSAGRTSRSTRFTASRDVTPAGLLTFSTPNRAMRPRIVSVPGGGCPAQR